MAREPLSILACETPQAWVNAALEDLETLLIDHANCERKAASNAMNLMYGHVSKTELMLIMSRLAREELLHFQQVVGLMKERGIQYLRLGPSRYAEGLRRHIDRRVDHGLVDLLLIGAFVEARSCERFRLLAPLLDESLGRFYAGLARSEARHFEDYLGLAERYATSDLAARIRFFAETEKALIETPDSQFRFHSGAPEDVTSTDRQHRHASG